MPAPARTSLAALRRHVIAAQGFAPRFRRASHDDVLVAVRRLSCVQLDSIATVDRSHKLVLASRIGALPEDATSRLLSEGKLIEYWAHEACLLPAEDWPLFRRRMKERAIHHWWGDVIGEDPKLARAVMSEIKKRGPLGSRHFEGRNVGMWGLKPHKQMLDALWTAGKLAVVSRDGFQRMYDLPERVLARSLLDARVPSESKTLRVLAARAVRARGALTLAGIVEHYRLRGLKAKVASALGALEKGGTLRRVAVKDGPDVWVDADVDLDATRAQTTSVLLSPFDNLLWDRAFARRVFDFDHVMEIYKKPHGRKYGYYVMPWLRGERFAGRADVKADREAGLLRLRKLHLEAGVRRSDALDEDFARAFERLARGLGLSPEA